MLTKSKIIFPQEHLQRVSESGETSWTFVKVPKNKGLRVAHSLIFCSFVTFNKTGKRKKPKFSLLKFGSYILKQLGRVSIIMS